MTTVVERGSGCGSRVGGAAFVNEMDHPCLGVAWDLRATQRTSYFTSTWRRTGLGSHVCVKLFVNDGVLAAGALAKLGPKIALTQQMVR